MENSGEQPLSMSLTSSSHLSNGSTDNNNNKKHGGQEAKGNVVMSLNTLSSNMEQMLSDSVTGFSDAEFVVENSTISVHRCILAVRSKYFREYFRMDKGFAGKDGKGRYYLRELLPFGKIGYEAFLILVTYLYTGRLNPSPLDVCTCVDNLCTHEACGPAIDFAVELMYASTIFEVSELASLFQRHLLSLADKATAEDVIPILVAAFHCRLSQILIKCVKKVAQSKLENINIEKEVPPKVAEDIKQFRLNSQPKEESDAKIVDPLREKRIKRILKALDSEDIELLRLLLSESNITLDEAYALHYAVAYCDPKTVSELLSLGMADVNLRNSQGKTVIHVAARRKEPSIIVSLLSKGARVSETTLGGRSALIICKRLTRSKDYLMKRERGQEENKDRICVDVLERELLRDPFGKESITSPEMVDDLQMKLMYLEDRVAFARMLFPTEAKLAMDIARAETTSDLAGLMPSRHSSGNLREVDLNETPLAQNERLFSRIDTLSRTVVFGRRYFPHCSEVLDRLMEDDSPDAFYLEKGTPEEQKMKRERFMELKDEVNKAFNKDKAKLNRSGVSASSSSSPRSSKFRIGCKARKL